jgi:hypothetical protein
MHPSAYPTSRTARRNRGLFGLHFKKCSKAPIGTSVRASHLNLNDRDRDAAYRAQPARHNIRHSTRFPLHKLSPLSDT